MADRSSFFEVLVENLEKPIAEHLNNSDKTRAQFDKTSEGIVEGKYLKLTNHIGRNSGIGYRLEGEQTALPGAQSFNNGLINLHKVIARMAVTSEVVDSSATDEGALAQVIPTEKSGLMNDAKRELNFLLLAEGDGVIAHTDVTTASTTVQLLDSTPESYMRYLADVSSGEGLRIDIGTVAAPTVIASNRVVSSVNIAARTFVISGAAVTTNATTHRIFRQGQGGTGASQRVVTSLDQLIGTQTLFGIDPTVDATWKSSVVDAEDGPVNEDVFLDLFDQIDISSGVTPGSKHLIITSHDVKRQYIRSFADRTRFVPLEINGGYKANVSVTGGEDPVGMISDRDCRDRTAYLVYTPGIKRAVGEEWNFIDMAGSGDKYVYDPDTDVFHMSLRARHEYFTPDRRSHGKLENLGPAPE